jgi:hypothetical protein
MNYIGYDSEYLRGYSRNYSDGNDSNEFSESDVDMTDVDMSRIEETEMNYQIEDKQHLKYYIGIYEIDESNNFVMTTTVTIQSFRAYEYRLIETYLGYYFVSDYTPINIDIMQLYISNDSTYTVILKTFWLRIVQRTWRRIFNQRSKIIQIRKSVSSQEYFRLNGKYPSYASRLYGYNGIIKSNKIQK